ncbi:MAG: DUF1553 domain-containing protein [Pirellulaceae bacterium]
MLCFRNTSFYLIVIAGLTAPLAGVPFADEVDFDRDIQPIFREHCVECHGAQQQESGLRLDRRSSALRGGDLGLASIVPGQPESSFLLSVLRGNNEHEITMPPEGGPLADETIEKFQLWIAQGAPWPGQMEATADDIESELWSLKPLAPGSTQVGAELRRSQGEDQRLDDSLIDAHVFAALSAKGLQFSPRADPVVLLRRASLVLTGLPPSPEEVNEYLAQLDHDGPHIAYTAAIDRLLQSPRYGERWAQHWLDVIRWAETVGFETNAERPNAWPYRDWVIESLNADKPYNQFLFEQIAGDTVGEDAALGFLTAGPANLPGQIGRDEEAMRQARQDELDEVINTVCQATLGLTIGCARCHNHKFDPILQRDYYAMQAIFAGLQYGDRRLRGELNDQWTAQLPEARQKLRELEERAAALRDQLQLQPPLSDLHQETFEPVLATAVRMNISATGSGGVASLYEFQVWSKPDEKQAASENVALATAGAKPSASSFALSNQTRHFDNLIDGSSDRRQAFPWEASQGGPAWIQIDLPEPTRIDRVVWDRGSTMPADYTISVQPASASTSAGDDTWITVADTTRRWPREDDTRQAAQIRLQNVSETDVEAIVSVHGELRSARAKLNRLSAGPQVYAANFTDNPEPTWLLSRGDPMSRREIVAPAIPKVLGDLRLSSETPEQQRRVAFAKHLIDPQHPLTARVIVNRIWHHHFGSGLVDTPSDFGEMGATPTHAALLDHLATEFITNGWSLKTLHRQIATSRTFQQASLPNDQAQQVDADSRWLWRFPPRRLEAEAIRDSVLQCSGSLNLDMGGPGFNFFKQRGGLSDYEPLETFDVTGWRRMIYAHKVRMQSVNIFGAFDCPDAGQMQPKRTQSITPAQSLGLFNSPFTLRQAEMFADRIRAKAGDEPALQVHTAFRIALSRSPTTEESSELAKLVEQAGLTQLCRVLFNCSEFLYIQ